MALFQAAPLAPEVGGNVRLYFEAQGFDGCTRILSLDSYLGRDFHTGPPTRCNTIEDYSAGGGCEPKLAIGVDVDGERPGRITVHLFGGADGADESVMAPGRQMLESEEQQMSGRSAAW